jgi:phospholipid/cholesterol/gamma-HCH transport system substrate-binding protein
MNKPFKFRYVNEIVGVFVLVVVAALIVGIILAGRAQEWFVPVHHLVLDFPEEGSLGLQKGAEVQILGTPVGVVQKIRVRDDGRMTGRISVKGDFIRFLRTDSRAVVKKKFGIAGDAFVELTQGRGAERDLDLPLLASKDTELTEIAQDILKRLQETTVPAIEEYTALAADLRSTNGPLMKLLAHLEQITAGLERGEGSAGQLLRDPTLANEVQRILTQVNEALAEVKTILADVKNTTAQLPPAAATVGREVEDLPGMVLQTQETLREAERLIEGIQQHWLIRRHVPPTPGTELIPASQATGF